ncbi:MAG: type II secretion system protein [Fusobacteriaceae bacterium]
MSKRNKKILMRKTNRNKKSGFTLIELVVVIAIIGVLATIITPKVRTSLIRSKDSKGTASLGALRTVVNIYYSEQGKKLDGTPATSSGVVQMTGKDLLDLKNAGYIDEKTLNALSPNGVGATSLASISVGSLLALDQTTGCSKIDGSGKLGDKAIMQDGRIALVYSADGLDVNLNPEILYKNDSVASAWGGSSLPAASSDLMDSSCQSWSGK